MSLLLVVISASTTALGVFTIAGLSVIVAAILALIALPAEDIAAEESKSLAWEAYSRRGLPAQSVLHDAGEKNLR